MSEALSKKEKNGLNRLYRRYKKNARYGARVFKLSLFVFKKIILSNCFYCGSPPLTLIRERSGTLLYNGIDRMNQTAGYTKDNCVPCCKKCNFLKGSFSNEEFLKQIHSIAVHFLKMAKR